MFTFSEWAERNPPEREVSGIGNNATTARRTWTVEVPFEHPKEYAEHPKTLAGEIRKKRIESGLTQKTLAMLLNVAECTVYNWERGMGPRGGAKSRVLAYLDASPISQNTNPGS